MSRRLILIVDDQSELRKLIRMTLEPLDCDLHEAASGLEALAKVRTLRPAVVILDVMLPGGLDGYQVCQAIKSDPKTQQIRVIMVTARGQKTDIEEGQRVKADCYLVKPFSPMQLIREVDNY